MAHAPGGRHISGKGGALRNVEDYEVRLRSRLQELQERLNEVESALEEEPDDDFEERAVERKDDEVLEGLGHAGALEIRMIRAALDRIKDGTFGYCVNCGREIAEARLDLVPHAARCARCA